MLTAAVSAQDKSLSLYFSFDEAAGDEVRDRSGNKNNGTFKGTVKWVGGKFNDGGLELRSPFGSIVVQHADNLEPDELTAAAWIFDNGDAPYPFKLVGKAEGRFGVLEGWVCGVSGNGHQMYPEFQDVDKRYLTFEGKDAVPTGEWVHLAWTYSLKEKALTAWLNGEENRRLQTGGKPIAKTGVSLVVGSQPWAIGAHSFKGVIDELRIYRRALSEKELNNLMKSQKQAVEPSGKLATTWASLKGQ